MAEELVEDNYL